jgi:hypothetical protein
MCGSGPKLRKSCATWCEVSCGKFCFLGVGGTPPPAFRMVIKTKGYKLGSWNLLKIGKLSKGKNRKGNS